MQCPTNSFQFNTTSCSCNPGHIYNTSTNTCTLFSSPGPPFLITSSGVDYDSTFGFPQPIFDSIKVFTQSQAMFLEVTGVMLLCWLGFCVFVRFFPFGDGRSVWFKFRWLISRLDVEFSSRHWVKEREGLVKRKTELGGAFSIASWILFIGLFAALLYQTISNRSIEVHNVRATTEPDLASFSNELQFNITTISSMSCAQLRGLGTLVTGNPAFIDQRVVPLSTFASYSCVNTSLGPTITLHCTNCRLIRDFAYVSWQFIDLPGNPATAVGFQFNLTAKNTAHQRHLSFVSGTLKNASNFDGRPVTYRGAVPNILKFNFFPRIYHNLHDLKLLQPMFHEFLPGSGSEEITQLRTSLESSSNGVVNTTLFVNFLSSYIVEIDNQNILGPVSFLADLGGLYCISIGIFLFILVQCEYRIKRLRNEDTVMRTITNRRKAQERWQKLRKYVRYTWASSLFDDNYRSETSAACCNGVMMKSMHRRNVSKNKRKLPNKTDPINLSIKAAVPNEKKTVLKLHPAQEVRSDLTEPTSNLTKTSSSSIDKQGAVNSEPSFSSCWQGVSRSQGVDVIDPTKILSLPPFEFGESSEISLIDLQKNLQNLYEYNVMLREKLVETQAMVHVSRKNEPPSMSP